jgi:hypothetical protein
LTSTGVRGKCLGARGWRNGRRASLRCLWPKGCAGSSPASRTNLTKRRRVTPCGVCAFGPPESASAPRAAGDADIGRGGATSLDPRRSRSRRRSDRPGLRVWTHAAAAGAPRVAAVTRSLGATQATYGAFGELLLSAARVCWLWPRVWLVNRSRPVLSSATRVVPAAPSRSICADSVRISPTVRSVAGAPISRTYRALPSGRRLHVSGAMQLP